MMMKNAARCCLLAAWSPLAPLCAETIVIQNATVMTVTKGTSKAPSW